MSLEKIRQLIADIPKYGDQEESFTHSAFKLVVVMLLLIILTELLFIVGVGVESLLMLYFFGVLIVSVVTPRYGFGIASAVIASLAYTILISEPGFGSIFGFHFFSTLITMLIVTVAASTLTTMLRLHSYLTYIKAERADILYTLGEELSEAADAGAVAGLTANCLSKHLDCPVVVYLSDPAKDASVPVIPAAAVGDSASFLAADELLCAHRVYISASASSLLAEEERDIFYQPMSWRANTYGVVGVNFTGKPVNQRNKEFIDLVCRQAAHVLELHQERRRQNEFRLDVEREKVQGNLLSSISHDFHVPLAAILGASDAILEQNDMLVEIRNSHLRDIQVNARWLIRIVENILTATRISKETTELNKRLESAEDVVNRALVIINRRFPGSMIHVRAPEQPLMVPMDATLIIQVLVNLLQNAIKHSGSDSLTLINIRERGRLALFEVSDHGAGIPEHLIDKIFEIRTLAEVDVAPDVERGTGIGLNVCRTIIQAHGGIIEASNRKEGGARFSFWLPLDDKSL